MSLKRNMRIKALVLSIFGVVLLFVVFAGIKALMPRAGAHDNAVKNSDEVIENIRAGLREHSAGITITFRSKADIHSELLQYAEEWMNAAMAETDRPDEGDYIKYQYEGYESSCAYEYSGGRYIYTVKIVPKYYIYQAQEETAEEKLSEVMEGFGFDESASDFDKAYAIYDYLCKNVTYDIIHKKNPYYYKRSTAYAALVQGTATCQGYAITLYRMLREAGINARVITGAAEGREESGFHAWNIAELDGVWYNLDSTWDAGKEEYSYFLKGSGDFKDHIPGDEFLTEEFLSAYPISETSYIY